MDLSKCGALCNCTDYTSMKPVLLTYLGGLSKEVEGIQECIILIHVYVTGHTNQV